jgi:tetratricopeptide (TPR) repeat protein
LLAGLAAEKPDNPYYQLDLAAADEEVGDVLVARGKLDEALKLYRDSLAISERLAAADRGNRARQHALSSSYARIGSVLVAQGKLDEALKVYRLDLDISARLAAADRHNSRWQHDLAAAYLHVGDIKEGAIGATRFASGLGRHGDFSRI